jgi:SAM-dependent methyltransferase
LADTLWGYRLHAIGTDGHWDGVYADRRDDEVSWYQRVPAVALELIDALDLPPTAGVVDVGAGASRLVGELLGRGFVDLTALDISQAGLDVARARLAVEAGPARAGAVSWLCRDVLAWDPGRTFDLWHDRAVFHFLVDRGDRDRYREVLLGAVAEGGHVVMATFAADGPERCSGLPVQRYDAEALAAALGAELDLVEARREVHTTPAGVTQPFIWVMLRRRGHSPAGKAKLDGT